jgi:hypothetical protein
MGVTQNKWQCNDTKKWHKSVEVGIDCPNLNANEFKNTRNFSKSKKHEKLKRKKNL